MNSELLRNGSGYDDPTAAQAIRNMVRPGEIWSTTLGKEVLILKDNGVVCTVLILQEEEKAGCIEVVSRSKRWCNPKFLTYTLRQNIGGFIKRMHDDEYGYIRQRVQEAMGFAGGAGEGQKEVHALKAENEKLRKQLHESELARQREKEEVLPYKRMYYDLWDRYTKRG